LQGSLFFGTARQFYNDLEADARKSRYMILDMLRVTSIDVTATHVLEQVYALMKQSGCKLVFANFHDRQNIDVQTVLSLMGVNVIDDAHVGGDVCLFDSLDEAIEWVENQILGKHKDDVLKEEALCLSEMDLFRSLKEETIADMASVMEVKTFAKDDHIYNIGDPGDALYLVRRGRVKIIAPIGGGRRLHHIATIGRGNFFGGMSFLDGQRRGDIALADTELEVFVLSIEQFGHLSETHKHLSSLLIQALAKALSHRLRRTDGELTLLLE
jgi:SulP family sulfate permease